MPRGTPDNLIPGARRGDEPLTNSISIRVTEEMKEEVKAKDDPPQYCRDAIQEKLDKDRK